MHRKTGNLRVAIRTVHPRHTLTKPEAYPRCFDTTHVVYRKICPQAMELSASD